MPNPFVRVPTGSTTNTDRPAPDAVRMETVEGVNWPYRGLETHGVEPSVRPVDPDTGYGFDVDDPDDRKQFEPYKEPDPDPEPIPVRIVTGEHRRELRSFGTDRITVDNTTANNAADRATELIGRSDARTSVSIKNLDATNWVLIGGTREEVAMKGYPLAPGVEKTFSAETPVFAVARTPALAGNVAVVVGLFTEYVVQVP